MLAGAEGGELVDALIAGAPGLDEQRATVEVVAFLAAVDAEGLLVVHG